MFTKKRPISASVLLALLSLGAALLATSYSPAEDDDGAKQPINPSSLTFEKHIVPIFRSRCFKCHGGTSQKAGLDLRRRFTLLQGGDSGPGLDLKQPRMSLLLEMIEEGEMPPEGSPKLSDANRMAIHRWVAEGARLQGKDELPLPDTDGDHQLTAKDRDFWAFKPPQRPTVPTVRHGDLVRTPIDAFLLAQLEPHGASFMPAADKNTLIRRLSFALHGLPPTSEQVQNFVNNSSSNAYEELIDELLDSPRYGERWGRHWLDVAGYADSDGYLEADRLRPEAWRYRDYVIRSINADKPFDRFLLEQIAGDELADWRQADELTPEMVDNLIATGFMRMAPDPTYPGYIEQPEVNQVIADTVEIFSTSLLGLTLQCARCHEHKMDPFAQRDYYQLWAFFDPALDAKRWIVSPQRNLPMASEEEVKRVAGDNQRTNARIKQLEASITSSTARFRDKALRTDLAEIKDATLLKNLKAAILLDPKKRNTDQKQLIAENAAGVKVSQADLSKRFPAFEQQLSKLNAAIASETSLRESIVQIRGIYDLEGEPQPTHLLKRGDFRTPGIVVKPHLPRVLAPAGYELQIRPGYRTSGRRLALARWLVDPKNPLTARVQVNRVWAQYFGTGIVSSLDNFGKIGARPTHPDLLDWLATEFIKQGWSLKKLHRLILNSSAFRQSSQLNVKLQTIDPSNELLGSWPPRRIEGEAIRDAILSVAGKLNLTMYGSPVPVNRNSQGLVTAVDTSAGNRRSIYLIVRRSQAVTLLELFDTPTMETNCTQRTKSIVVTQALSMLNSGFTASNAKTLAKRVIEKRPNDPKSRLDTLFQLAYSRSPTAVEHREYFEFLRSVAALSTTADPSTKAEPNSKEEKQRNEMDAWTQLAIVVFNSNEFLYVP